MRGLWLVMAGLTLAGCATSAQQEMSRLNKTATTGGLSEEACLDRMRASPPFSALKGKAPDGTPSLAALTNRDKATREEIVEIYALHHDYLTPCRKLRLETAAKLDPSLVGVYADGFAKADAAYVALVERRATWGEFAQQYDAIRKATAEKAAMVGERITQGLDRSHAAELARRRAAINALQGWAVQALALMQQQQMAAPAAQPQQPMSCQYVGWQLSCTSY